MEKKMKLLHVKVKKFIPKFLNSAGNEVEMKKDGAKLVITSGSTGLMINEGVLIELGKINKATIDILRADIYQTFESTNELKEVHEKLKEAYVEVERKYMNKFIKDNYSYKKVTDDK